MHDRTIDQALACPQMYAYYNHLKILKQGQKLLRIMQNQFVVDILPHRLPTFLSREYYMCVNKMTRFSIIFNAFYIMHIFLMNFRFYVSMLNPAG